MPPYTFSDRIRIRVWSEFPVLYVGTSYSRTSFQKYAYECYDKVDMFEGIKIWGTVF